ncbi:hypothetical protein DH2020_031031 [Rehmannia glutinosa]|uniref:Protein kinase domain-containing protein n=1 Tax=Rehmannia glutinosa TaxID=99300 RepID=A0ABR0VJ55_REHGL
MGINLIFSAILVYGLLYSLATAEPVEDKRALLDFIGSISHSRNLNWDQRTSACNIWTGVTCNHDKSRVIAVRLPGIRFRTSIPTNTLSRLSALQILSLRSNGISGPFPSDLLNLRNLTGLYLQFNNFQGPLPLDFSVWENLSVLDLSNNRFNGSIPSSISNLTHLTALDLANNSLSGDIPDLNIPSLQMLDLTNNNLTGFVPQSLSRFPSSAFSGNNITLQNLLSPVSSPTTTVRKRHSSKVSEPAILGIVIGSCTVAFVSIALLLIVMNRKKKDGAITATSQKKEKSTKRSVSEHRDVNGRITFFEGCNLVFDLEDLLRASAEVLGKGTFGTTYKAALEDATTVAVKRLREVIVGKKDFEQQMEVVGNIRHENVAPLRAYYYSKDEKLMVYDYYNQGSVSALLHGMASVPKRISPVQTKGRFMSRSVNLDHCFGVFLLELLTGKSPVHSLGGEEVIHLVRWVQSVVREEWTGEVFDVELLRYPNIEEEMVAMLQIGLSCVARMPEQRPKIGDVVKMVEDIRSVNTSNSPFGGTGSPGSTPTLTPNVGEIGSSMGPN